MKRQLIFLLVGICILTSVLTYTNVADTGIITNGNVTADWFFGKFAGNFSGNFTGNFTGNFIGNFSGNYTGNFSGNFYGNFTGNGTYLTNVNATLLLGFNWTSNPFFLNWTTWSYNMTAGANNWTIYYLSTYYYNRTDLYNISEVNDTFVPYIGAVKNINLGVRNITTQGYVSTYDLETLSLRPVGLNTWASYYMNIQPGAGWYWNISSNTFFGSGLGLTGVCYTNGSNCPIFLNISVNNSDYLDGIHSVGFCYANGTNSTGDNCIYGSTGNPFDQDLNTTNRPSFISIGTQNISNADTIRTRRLLALNNNLSIALGYSVDTTSGYVDFLDDPDWNAQTFTINAWVNYSSFSTDAIVAQNDLAGNYWKWWYNSVDDKFYFEYVDSLSGVHTASSSATAGAMTKGEWHMVSVARKGTNPGAGRTYFYIDGTSLGFSAPSTLSIVNVASPLYIGTGDTSTFIAGQIDEVTFWKNTLLSSSTIVSLYNTGTGTYGDVANSPFDTASAGWHFDENTGVSAADYISSHTGTLESSASWATGKIMAPVAFADTGENILTDGDIRGVNFYGNNLCYANGTNSTGDFCNSPGGNPFDQDLNTTNTPTFAGINPLSDLSYNLGVDNSLQWLWTFTAAVGLPTMTGYFFDLSSGYGTMGQIYDLSYTNVIDLSDGVLASANTSVDFDNGWLGSTYNWLTGKMYLDLDMNTNDISAVDVLTANRGRFGSWSASGVGNNTETLGEILSLSFNNSDINDTSFYGNNGTTTGTVTFTTGMIGLAHTSDGSAGNYGYVGDAPQYSQLRGHGAGDFSINLWQYRSGTVAAWYQDAWIGQDMGSGGQPKWIWGWETISTNTGQLHWHNGANNINSNTVTMIQNTWHMVTITFDDATNTYTQYVDGSPQGSTVDGTTGSDPTVAVSIGFGEGSATFNGKIDEVKIWNRTLTAAEVTALYGLQGVVDSGEELVVNGNASITKNLYAPNVCYSNGSNCNSSISGNLDMQGNNITNINYLNPEGTSFYSGAGFLFTPGYVLSFDLNSHAYMGDDTGGGVGDITLASRILSFADDQANNILLIWDTTADILYPAVDGNISLGNSTNSFFSIYLSSIYGDNLLNKDTGLNRFNLNVGEMYDVNEQISLALDERNSYDDAGNPTFNWNNSVFNNNITAPNVCYSNGSQCTTTNANINNTNINISSIIVQKNIIQETGNASINNYYGSVYNFSDAGWNIGIAATGGYYNLTISTSGELNGFKVIHEGVNGTKLNTLVAGYYAADAVITGEFAGGEYGIGVVTNGADPEVLGRCYTRTNANGEFPIPVTCFKRLAVGDNVTLVIDDESNPVKDVKVHNINLRLFRVGN